MTEPELREFLKQNPPAGEFAPYSYLHDGTLTVYFKDDADYTERLTDEITLCLSLETGEIVGCHVAVEAPSWKPKPDAPGWWVMSHSSRPELRLVAMRDGIAQTQFGLPITTQPGVKWIGPLPTQCRRDRVM